MPFTLGETREYLQSRGVRWPEQMLAECYMVMGGIPYYLQQIDRSMSLAQNVDRMFFRENASLGIAGVATKTFAYQTDGAQVDMVTRAGGQDGVHVRDEVVGHAVREKYPRYALMVVMVTSGGLVQNRRTSERRGRAGSDYPERELTTSREESGARSDYPEARRKKTIVKEENRRLTSMQCKPCNGK
ncbi:MAG: hypothetical protein J5545_10675 [Bacteroidaceae bacterium]|nr:hypothetical protein [Bacteroidaceae bacterium]